MNEFKYQISQIILLVLLGAGGYWAFTHLDSGVTYTRDQVVDRDAVAITSPIPDGTANIIDNQVVEGEVSEEAPTPVDSEPSQIPESGNTELLNDLNGIRDSGVILASGTRNENVEKVQEFLDIYFDSRDITIDGDYGPGTKNLVLEFQRAELNGGDGRVGPNTLGKMIEVLETL